MTGLFNSYQPATRNLLLSALALTPAKICAFGRKTVGRFF